MTNLKHPNPDKLDNTVMNMVESVAKDSYVKRLKDTIKTLKENKPAWYTVWATAITLLSTAILSAIDRALDLYIKFHDFIN